MPESKIVVYFDEIFNFAEEKYNIEWNTCCDMFHRRSILCNDEGKNTTINMEDLEYNLKEDQKGKYKLNPSDKLSYEIIINFMKQHNLTEMYVDND